MTSRVGRPTPGVKAPTYPWNSKFGLSQTHLYNSAEECLGYAGFRTQNR